MPMANWVAEEAESVVSTLAAWVIDIPSTPPSASKRLNAVVLFLTTERGACRA